ncbi:DNA methyltransferase [Candidatus Chloroploca asiatica]|uniref:DNA methyltransferase n=1 Tax=Candidatus Chloroploca asiatica TaxID=1506545 RepID=UPI001FE3BF9D|nr:DNA methyltransferase [Candidatus Chloroploca asiatica]
MTFANDEARRAYFTEKLREKLRDPAFRTIEGFPVGSDEDMLALSDPPYYTACPNPFLEDFVRVYGTPYDADEVYRREPFAVDVSEGKTDTLYTAHSYHTKVPYKAIVRAILHYTEPGDLVLDGFSGSGMTGVAAQVCATLDSELVLALQKEWQTAERTPLKVGARRAVLNDLGPAASFISANYNLSFDVDAFEREAKRILAELRTELGWMYVTRHSDGREGNINYTVWSEVFTCPNCSNEITFLEEALDENGRVRPAFPCPHCGVELTKESVERTFDTHIDHSTGEAWQRIRFTPVLINYNVGSTRYEKKPDEQDLAVLAHIMPMPLPSSVPTNTFPIKKMYHGSRLAPKGFTHIHHLFLPRAAQAIGSLWGKAASIEDARLRHIVQFFIEQAIWGMSLLNRYSPIHFSQVNRQLNGVYYIASQHSEVSPWYNLENKLERLGKAFRKSYAKLDQAIITTGTAARLGLPDQSIDYIFTDPPFGENIYYADLNFLVESWHRVWTNPAPEAIVDQAKKKQLADYQRLMQHCFEEYYRVLKPGRWMTVVFHNSRNSVWNAIQEAMRVAGFVVADVRTMDKQQGSYRQVTSSAVKQDLVISAYKANEGLEARFRLEAGSPQAAWDFVRTHLRQLPIFLTKQGKVEVVAERLPFVLFDRMVAFHVQRGVAVPLSAQEFQAGLAQRFPPRDGMYFLPEQIAEYERKRMTVREIQQLAIYVTSEDSAIQWIKQQLTNKPQTIAELTPQFMRELNAWPKHEQLLELRMLLEENFLSYTGATAIPAQIVTWMKKSSDLRDLIADELARGTATAEQGALTTANPRLINAARDRWYVPDPNRAIDLEQLRTRSLLKEFATYLEGTRKLKQFRSEAIKAGFKQAWNTKDFATIVRIAERLPESVVQEDPDLLMYYDNASLRVR